MTRRECLVALFATVLPSRASSLVVNFNGPILGNSDMRREIRAALLGPGTMVALHGKERVMGEVAALTVRVNENIAELSRELANLERQWERLGWKLQSIGSGLKV